MNKSEQGQVIVIVAVLLVVTLLFLAVIIDGARLMVEQQELNRAADAAGKAGLIVVGDRMVTQVVQAQTAAASITLTATPVGSTPGPTLTPTPAPDDFYSWLREDHRKTLVAPPMQTLVATQVKGSTEENGLGLSNPAVTDLKIIYPDQYLVGANNIQIYVRIERIVAVVFGSILGLDEGILAGDTKQSIPQR
ncbi:MAG: pilus assembly protein TadG-related protein [Anaerolineales bacterium]|nr:pilus assembly protein TadG-related protein [Anaerolineales bacterium]